MRNWGNQGNLWFPGGFQANCRCKAKTPGKYFLSATAEAYRGWGIRAQPPLNKGTLWFPEDFFYPPPWVWEKLQCIPLFASIYLLNLLRIFVDVCKIAIRTKL